MPPVGVCKFYGREHATKEKKKEENGRKEEIILLPPYGALSLGNWIRQNGLKPRRGRRQTLIIIVIFFPSSSSLGLFLLCCWSMKTKASRLFAISDDACNSPSSAVSSAVWTLLNGCWWQWLELYTHTHTHIHETLELHRIWLVSSSRGFFSYFLGLLIKEDNISTHAASSICSCLYIVI